MISHRPTMASAYLCSGHGDSPKAPLISMNGSRQSPPRPSCAAGTVTGLNGARSPAAVITTNWASQSAPTRLHLTEATRHGTITLLTATRDMRHSQAAVLAERLRHQR